MINQLDNEYNQIYTSVTDPRTKIKEKIYGHEALTMYSESVYQYYDKTNLKKFSEYYIADFLLLVIRSYKLIDERINISKLSPELKNLFLDKLQTFYLCKLDDPLIKLTELFKRVAALNDT